MEPPGRRARPDPWGLQAQLGQRVRPALPGRRVPPDRRGRRAETERQEVRGLLDQWLQSYIRNLSDSFTADYIEVIFVILYELYNAAELVCKVKFNFQLAALMDIYGLD